MITTTERIHTVLARIETLLVEKNAAYGDSALHPVRIFSRAAPTAQLKVGLDDKLSRHRARPRPRRHRERAP